MTNLRLDYVREYFDRHGKLRRYFRRRGSKQIPLPGLPGSDEFMAAYQAALASVILPREIGASRTKPGTVNAAIVGYYQSMAFRGLAASTQYQRRLILEKVRNEVGERQIAGLESKLVVRRLSGLKAGCRARLVKGIAGPAGFCCGRGVPRRQPDKGN